MYTDKEAGDVSCHLDGWYKDSNWANACIWVTFSRSVNADVLLPAGVWMVAPGLCLSPAAWFSTEPVS